MPDQWRLRASHEAGPRLTAAAGAGARPGRARSPQAAARRQPGSTHEFVLARLKVSSLWQWGETDLRCTGWLSEAKIGSNGRGVLAVLALSIYL